MTTADATLHSRDPFMPRRPPGMRTGLALALLAHAVLIAGLAYSVDWHASDPVAVEAELWSAVPQQAAAAPAPPPPPPPQAVQPTPAPPPAPAPKPPPAPPAPPPQVDPQIAIEKAREAKRVQQQEELAEQEKARRDKARRDQAKQEQDRKLAEQQQQARDDAQRKKQQLAEKQQADREKAEQAKAEQAKAEKADKAAAAQREAARLAQIKRMQSLAGATGDNSTTGGSAAKSSGPSAGYAGRIVARIKPNIVFPDSIDGNPMASVEVRVAPDGSITARRLVQSSGVKAWDDAVLRAIDRTDGLPRDIDGRVPPLMTINFRPRDL